jgi:DNA polymerase-3 subunit epsilon
VRGDSRPEYYDFDLFAGQRSAARWPTGALTELTYTVFDTETTGLNPERRRRDHPDRRRAHRQWQAAASRKASSSWSTRSVRSRGIPIHGITARHGAGQPTIDQVLPAFHAFAQDTVLVAHNAAFDMRFLQLKEERTGLRFDQPVLDTLLLSALVHPNQESHRLEAIAERFDITVIGRHTALGDAMVTAEVFLKLIPLLAEKGIHTLGQAREARSRRTTRG